MEVNTGYFIDEHGSFIDRIFYRGEDTIRECSENSCELVNEFLTKEITKSVIYKIRETREEISEKEDSLADLKIYITDLENDISLLKKYCYE